MSYLLDEDLDVENMKANDIRKIIFDELYQYRSPDIGLELKSFCHIRKEELIRLYHHLAELSPVGEEIERPSLPSIPARNHTSYRYKAEMLHLTGFDASSTTKIPSTLYEALVNYQSRKREHSSSS